MPILLDAHSLAQVSNKQSHLHLYSDKLELYDFRIELRNLKCTFGTFCKTVLSAKLCIAVATCWWLQIFPACTTDR